MDRNEAHAAAQRIKEYWRARGAEVTTSVYYVPGSKTNDYGEFCIQSDLVNGLPQKRKSKTPDLPPGLPLIRRRPRTGASA